MRFRVGITDGDWFETLHRQRPDEGNFWQPSDRPPRTMAPGWPFLFKLHSPRNFIVGGGFFVRFTVLPCFLAWDAFGEKNGAAGLAELVARTARYRKAAQTPGTPIGCNVLTDPFFLDDGYVTVDPKLRFVVSPRLREEFENGRAYYALEGAPLANLPDRLTDQPGREFIEWHNAEVYIE